MKIVINRCFGGFGLSDEACELLGLVKQHSIDNTWSWYNDSSIPRNDPRLIEVVEKLGSKANRDCSELGIIEIPDGIDWEITEYDGLEKIEEVHRSWG
jgi:predicted Rossmann-fold nucleotide-binding protein